MTNQLTWRYLKIICIGELFDWDIKTRAVTIPIVINVDNRIKLTKTTYLLMVSIILICTPVICSSSITDGIRAKLLILRVFD